jgi:hypothetical protein
MENCVKELHINLSTTCHHPVEQHRKSRKEDESSDHEGWMPIELLLRILLPGDSISVLEDPENDKYKGCHKEDTCEDQ